MVEYTESLDIKITEPKESLLQRVLILISVKKGEIPYVKGGLDLSEFSKTSIQPTIQEYLKGLVSDIRVEEGIVTSVTLGLKYQL